ncbi:MAG: helix-turn-helix transcriptional regulator [Lentisphaeria bacterium]|nr:helix-turn-helix transcriptional regulator [Lentisphaeria bacterium]
MEKDTYLLDQCQRFYDFPLNIRSVARRYANSFRHRANKLLLIHLCFVLSEEEDEILELDGVKRYDSNPPFMRVTYPGTIAHHLHSSRRNELFFTYENSYLEAFRKFGFRDCNFRMTDRFKGLLEQVERLLPVCNSLGIADRLDRLAVMLGLEAMLSALEPSEEPARNGSNRIYQVEKYFQFHYSENFDLEEVLKQYGMSLRTFYREWRFAFPMSPAQYLLNLRMQKACRLLRNADLRIYEIANLCGYCNELYFCRVFAKSNGMTPQAYRKLHLNK